MKTSETCFGCGRTLKRDSATGRLLAIRSEYTGNFYCGMDFAKCEAGWKKRPSKAVLDVPLAPPKERAAKKARAKKSVNTGVLVAPLEKGARVGEGAADIGV